MYDPSASAWADLTGHLSGVPPAGRRFAGSALANGKIYIFGGFGSGGEYPSLKCIDYPDAVAYTEMNRTSSPFVPFI